MTDIEKVARDLLDQSRANFERQFGEVDWGAEWVYDDLHELFSTELAAIAVMQPAPQEPVGSAAEITRLTEVLRAAEEREKGLISALEEWMFRYFWRAEQMPVEAARIHAKSRLAAALKGPSHDA